MSAIRPPAVSGTFYPSDSGILRELIEKLMNEAKKGEAHKEELGVLKAVVVPHAGYAFSGAVAASGFQLLTPYSTESSVLFTILGPSHHVPFYGASVSTVDYWQTPLGKVKVSPISRKITDSADSKILIALEEAHKKEHSIEVQLPFLQYLFDDFEILPLCLGSVNPHTLARALIKNPEVKNSLFIVSSDLSHFYPYDTAVEMDSVINEAVPNLDTETIKLKGEACGKSGILTVMEIAKLKGWKAKFVDYKNSGDTSGDKSAVVGYGCYAFYGGEK